MKVKMNVSSAGPRGSRDAGQVYELDDTEASQLIAGGYAQEYIAPPNASEAAEASDGWGDGATRIAELEAANEELTRANQALTARIAELEAPAAPETATTSAPEQATAPPQRKNPRPAGRRAR